MSVTTTSASYQSLYDSIYKEFGGNSEPGSALLWWWLDSVDKFGVRVECPSLGKEFSNGMYIGRDPEGLLFFNDPADLSNPEGGPLNVNYNVYYNTDNSAPAFVIEWYNDGATRDQCFAKFLAKDPNRVANRIIDSKTGAWSDCATSESFARINKTSSTVNKWTLKVNSINLQVTFPTSGTVDTAAKPPKRVDTMGLLIWKDISQIKNGVYVDYRDDRIVFITSSEWSTDFCAFVSASTSFLVDFTFLHSILLVVFAGYITKFLPVESTVNEDPLGDYVIRAGGAQWSNIK